ncbi:hypothetical protein A2164_01275 [Candidatus Curtissbacteria bacterium RBG_13_35_7]|uniref:Uncharacterized protein n=1 Tax=Candidatus Curtissbacteria bacterium RBG_13_35_7 TaxID=1797705 RepID=A0A1F5G3A1_9BACT|nr:MAG: hypothetical protein A2164_01275 [Candidatus Curtissbacteria bacterium RBG_13_35_7]
MAEQQELTRHLEVLDSLLHSDTRIERLYTMNQLVGIGNDEAVALLKQVVKGMLRREEWEKVPVNHPYRPCWWCFKKKEKQVFEDKQIGPVFGADDQLTAIEALSLFKDNQRARSIVRGITHYYLTYRNLSTEKIIDKNKSRIELSGELLTSNRWKDNDVQKRLQLARSRVMQ